MAKAAAVPAPLPTSIASPDANVLWRITSAGAVERTTDGGSTWQLQSIGAGVAVTAGSAPGPTTCWLVGPAGTVLLSTDGRSWQRLPFPVQSRLTGVRASDAANATVVAADGGTFITADGGHTWRQP